MNKLKILAIILILGGIGGIIQKEYISIVLLILGIFLFFKKSNSQNKKISNKKVNKVKEEIVIQDNKSELEVDKNITNNIEPLEENNSLKEFLSSSKKYKNEFKTYITGLNYSNDKSKNIQSLINEYLEENAHNYFEDYTNSEIKEDDLDIWQYDHSDFDCIDFIFETDNKYDPNAIKVIHEEMGHIGYIPKNDTSKIKNILNSSNSYHADLDFKGGKHKFLTFDDNGKEKVKTEKRPYYINLVIDYE